MARLHADLEAIRARKRAEAVARLVTAIAQQDVTQSPIPDDTQAGELDLPGPTEGRAVD